MSIARPLPPDQGYRWARPDWAPPDARESLQLRAARAVIVAEGALLPAAAIILLISPASVSGFLGMVSFFNGPGLAWILVAILLGGVLEGVAATLGRRPSGWWGAVAVHAALLLCALGFVQWSTVSAYPLVASDLVLQWLVVPAFVLGLMVTPALRRATVARLGPAG